MADSEFLTEAMAVGFTRAQATWMEENLAEEGHQHDIDDIEGLEDRLDCDDSDDDDNSV